jgi:4-carboxymuconolactone decarboxylase
MKLLAATAITLSLFASAYAQTSSASDPAAAQAHGSQSIKIMRRGSQPSRQGATENFSGSVRVDSLFEARAPRRARGSLVTFEPAARTAWHTHPLGQVLIVTAGVGRVQRWGDPVDEIRKGDVVWIPPGQKHWHGAATNSSMAHIAIVEALDGQSVEWMEKVSDSQYSAAVRIETSPTNANSYLPRPSQRAIGDFSPKLAELTDNVLYADVWERPELSKRDRSLVTVAALIALNRPEQLRSHLMRARDNGVTQEELIETITHLAFYSGWPNAVTAVGVAREVFKKND